MHESHITVQDFDQREFATVCHDLGCKLIMIGHDTGSGSDQMMTGKFHKTDQHTATAELLAMADAIGQRVVRRKLEYIGKAEPPCLYLETHLKFVVPLAELPKFRELVSLNGGHTSQNLRKLEAGAGQQFVFATTREGSSRLEQVCLKAGFRFVNRIVERVVYDDNPTIDQHWRPCFDCSLKATLAS